MQATEAAYQTLIDDVVKSNNRTMDLKVYSMRHGGEVSHYRDSRGLECDAVVHLEDGRWALIEIKLGGDNLIDEGAANMKKLLKDINIKYTEQSQGFLHLKLKLVDNL